MLKTSQTKVKRFTKYLKKLLIETEGLRPSDLKDLPDEAILEIFRTCAGCDEELITSVQQTHAILEWDTPERALESLFELIKDKPCVKSDDDDFSDDYSCSDPNCANYQPGCDCDDE